MYQSENTLKRDLFAETIRKTQRERIRVNMRNSIFTQNSHAPIDPNYDEKKCGKLRMACRNSRFSQEAVGQFFDYICCRNNNNDRLARAPNIKFLNQLSITLSQKQFLLPWEEQVLPSIQNSIQMLIETELRYAPMNEKSGKREYEELYILHNCFTELLELLADNKVYGNLWEPLSSISNQSFQRLAFDHFKYFISKNLQSLADDNTLSPIIKALRNFAEYTDSKMSAELLMIADQILKEYRLGNEDFIELTSLLIACFKLSTFDCQQLTHIVIKDTTLLPELIHLLMDTDSKVCRDAAFNIFVWLGKLFSTHDQLCHEIFASCPMILKTLRRWMPYDEKITIEQLRDASHRPDSPRKLSNCSFHLLQGVLFALSNIVGSGESYVGQCLNSDIFLVLVYMYPAVPYPCKLYIAICLRNMMANVDSSIASVMIDLDALEIVMMAIGEENQELVEKALETIKIVMNVLCLSSELADNHGVIRSSKYAAEFLLGAGVKRILESLLCNKSQRLANLSEQVLNLLLKQVN